MATRISLLFARVPLCREDKTITEAMLGAEELDAEREDTAALEVDGVLNMTQP